MQTGLRVSFEALCANRSHSIVTAISLPRAWDRLTFGGIPRVPPPPGPCGRWGPNGANTSHLVVGQLPPGHSPTKHQR